MPRCSNGTRPALKSGDASDCTGGSNPSLGVRSQENNHMDYKNYIHIKTFSLRYNHYCFMDTDDYLADGLFIKRNVRVWFGDEYRNDKKGYTWIFCKIHKKDTEKFMLALEDLKRKMLLFGHADYQECCEALTCKEKLSA